MEYTSITAVLIQLYDRKVVVFSVYIPPRVDEHHLEELKNRLNLIRSTIVDQKTKHGPHLEILVAGDFNRHHHPWGRNQVVTNHTRQDEAEPIPDLMADHELESLLPGGTITFEGVRERSTNPMLGTSNRTWVRSSRYSVGF